MRILQASSVLHGRKTPSGFEMDVLFSPSVAEGDKTLTESSWVKQSLLLALQEAQSIFGAFHRCNMISVPRAACHHDFRFELDSVLSDSTRVCQQKKRIFLERHHGFCRLLSLVCGNKIIAWLSFPHRLKIPP